MILLVYFQVASRAVFILAGKLKVTTTFLYIHLLRRFHTASFAFAFPSLVMPKLSIYCR